MSQVTSLAVLTYLDASIGPYYHVWVEVPFVGKQFNIHPLFAYSFMVIHP